MKNAKGLVKPLLWFHLLLCVIWLYVFRSYEPRFMPVMLFLWSIVVIQFTWGFTVGLAVGPARKNRSKLWWSMLTIFMPLFFFSAPLFSLFAFHFFVGLLYLSAIVIILASETYAGVLLGAKMHSDTESI